MTRPKLTRNVYCTDIDDVVVPHKCAVCRSCWLFVAGNKKGMCPWGGPFAGKEQ